jgi:hypothetical protein
MVKIALAVLLLAHGIGHSMGLLQVFKVATVNPGWDGESWLLTGPAGTTWTHAVGVVLWTASIVGFAALAAAVMGWLPASAFDALAIASASASLLGLVLFPIAFPTFSTIGALIVDLGVLAAVTWYHWQPTDLA